jgi:hypothetical protein
MPTDLPQRRGSRPPRSFADAALGRLRFRFQVWRLWIRAIFGV